MTLAARIQSKLDTDGRSKYALAADADVDRTTLGRFLGGSSDPNWKTVAAVAAALRVKPAELGAMMYDSLREEADATHAADD